MTQEQSEKSFDYFRRCLLIPSVSQISPTVLFLSKASSTPAWILRSLITRRLPPLRPRVRAASNPASVRSLIRSRSNSAKAQKTWK
jgi:hypothetical protein